MGASRAPPLIGGQAIIEGVMFKSPSALSLGVRLPTGKIYTEATRYTSMTRRLHVHRIPFLRGIAIFVEMLYIGVSYLNKSASLAVEEKLEKGETASDNDSSFVTTLLMIFSFLLSIILALLAFKFLPLGISSLVWDRTTTPAVLFTLTEGIFKLLIFIIYLVLIRRMKDVFRVFQYHGAEHKTIRAFEAGKRLTVANVKAASRFHPRCGTSFVVFVILISILLYSLVPLQLPIWQLFLTRVALLPVLAGISYEVLALTARVSEKGPLRWLLAPGYFVQSLTTAEPDARQIEVSLASFNACRKIK